MNPSPHPSTAPLRILVRSAVEAHHQLTRDGLTRLRMPLDQLVRAGCPGSTEVVHVFDAVASLLLAHLVREERVVFPRILRLSRPAGTDGAPLGGTLAASLRLLEVEHGAIEAHLARLHAFAAALGTTDAPEGTAAAARALMDGLHALEDGLREHLRFEDEVLFPRALAEEAARRAPPAAGPTALRAHGDVSGSRSS